MSLAKQVQYALNQILRAEHLVIGDQYEVRKFMNGVPELLYNARLRLVYPSEQKIVLSMNDGTGDLHFDMHTLHIVPDEHGNWDASSFHLVRVPLLPK